MIEVLSRLRQRRLAQWGLAYLAGAWLILQLVNTLSDPWDIPSYMERGLAMVLAIGFFAALVLAWYHGEKGPQRVSGPELLILAALFLLSGIVLSLVSDDKNSKDVASAAEDASVSQPPDRTPISAGFEPSIAVLPFANHSLAEENAEFLAVGIHDELLTQLGQIDSLKVISRTSMLAYRDTTKNVRTIGKELGVLSILEGSVQRAGDSVRIQAKLIETRSEKQLWANTFEYTLSPAKLFAIQHEISTSIADALETNLSPSTNQRLAIVPTDSLAALEAYFKGKQQLEIRTIESLKTARVYFQEAIDLDPSFAHAYAGMAEAWLELPNYWSEADSVSVRQGADLATQKATELNSELPEALAVLGWQRLLHDFDWQGAESALRKALEIQPGNVLAQHWLSHVLSWQGRHDEALALAKRALELDPLSMLIRRNLAYIHMDAGEFDIATRQLSAIIEQDPHSTGIENLWTLQVRAGDIEGAVESFRAWGVTRERDPQLVEILTQGLREHKESGRVANIDGEVISGLSFILSDLAQVYAALGDADNTLEALSAASNSGTVSRSLLSIRINPSFDFVRDDPRFLALLDKIGLAD